MRIDILVTAIVAICAALSLSAQGQEYPTHQVRIVSSLPVGSGPDAAARVIADKLRTYWGQSVVIDARPGGQGFVSAHAVKGAPPEGYDLLMSDSGFVAVNPYLYKKFPFDFERDFEPAALLVRTPFYVAVGANSPISSVRELTDAARAKPGALSYGSPRIGSPSHLGGAEFESLTHTRMIHVPFTETSQLLNSLATGEVTWSLLSIATSRSMVDAKRIRLIAVAAKHRDPNRPDIPTVAEAGGPADLEVEAWVGLFARKGTASSVLEKINLDVSRVMREPDVLKFMSGAGYIPYVATRKEFAERIRKDMKVGADLVKRSGATAD